MLLMLLLLESSTADQLPPILVVALVTTAHVVSVGVGISVAAARLIVPSLALVAATVESLLSTSAGPKTQDVSTKRELRHS
jgi:hypothetical protein